MLSIEQRRHWLNAAAGYEKYTVEELVCLDEMLREMARLFVTMDPVTEETHAFDYRAGRGARRASTVGAGGIRDGRRAKFCRAHDNL